MSLIFCSGSQQRNEEGKCCFDGINGQQTAAGPPSVGSSVQSSVMFMWLVKKLLLCSRRAHSGSRASPGCLGGLGTAPRFLSKMPLDVWPPSGTLGRSPSQDLSESGCLNKVVCATIVSFGFGAMAGWANSNWEVRRAPSSSGPRSSPHALRPLKEAGAG